MNCSGEFCRSPIHVMLSKIGENDNIALMIIKNSEK